MIITVCTGLLCVLSALCVEEAGSFNPGLSGERGPCKKLFSSRSNGEGKFSQIKIEEKVNENPRSPV